MLFFNVGIEVLKWIWVNVYKNVGKNSEKQLSFILCNVIKNTKQYLGIFNAVEKLHFKHLAIFLSAKRQFKRGFISTLNLNIFELDFGKKKF